MKRAHLQAVVLFLVTLLLGSCAADEKTSGKAPVSWKQVEREVEVIGKTGPSLERSFTVYLPPGHGDGKPRAVVFGFHGAWGTGEGFARQSALHEADGADRFIVVYPDGYRRSWNVGPCCGAARDKNVDEIAFVRAMLKDIESLAAIDRRRVYATGFSNGAMLSYRLACDMAGAIAAIAPASAAMQVDAKSCMPSRPVPVMHLHGKADEWSPYAGGGSEWEKLESQPAIPTVIDIWVRKNGCKKQFEREILNGVSCQVHSQCAASAEVILCPVPGLGHQWAGHKPRPFSERKLGPGRPELEASEAVLGFFLEHPLPE